MSVTGFRRRLERRYRQRHEGSRSRRASHAGEGAERHIILTAIFPRNDNMDVMPEIDSINASLAKIADGRKIRYLNINDKLAGPDGKLFDGMLNERDKLHPTLTRLSVWADALKPILTELLGPPAAEDHAPPPTGDPSASR